MKTGETPETATRREVAERLAPLLGAAAARAAADALGGAPRDISWNGERLAEAIEAAIARRVAAALGEEAACDTHGIERRRCGCAT